MATYKAFTFACILTLAVTGIAPGQEVSPKGAVRATPSPGSVPVPLIYLPMHVLPFYNSNEPQMISDMGEFARLKFQMPQWLRQVIEFPPATEIQKFLGRDKPAERNRAIESIRSVVNRALLPDDFGSRMIPLAGWAVLYEDWINYGGTDVYLVKFQRKDHIIEILESHNHVILLLRDSQRKRGTDLAGAIKTAYELSDIALTEHLKTVSLENMKLFRTNNSPLYIYGYYSPRMDVLAGNPGVGDLVTSGGMANESSSSANASAVRFFSNGDFVAFMVLKPNMGTGMKNPFLARFERTNSSTQSGERPFFSSESAAADEGKATEQSMRSRQVEEYLGSFFFDEQGNKITEGMRMEDLERAFMEMSPEQKVAIVQEKVIDEHYISGLKAYMAKNYASAIEYWTRILDLAPENPRAAILLQMAIKAHAADKYGGNPEVARRDPIVATAQDAISRQQTLLGLKAEQAEQRKLRETAIIQFRTRALDFWAEGNYSDSLHEWNKILNIDPGNASALFFRDICEKKLKGSTSRLQQPPR